MNVLVDIFEIIWCLNVHIILAQSRVLMKNLFTGAQRTVCLATKTGSIHVIGRSLIEDLLPSIKTYTVSGVPYLIL
jgi:hypothetical protein